MSKLKRIFALVLTGAIMLFGLAGCGNNHEHPSGEQPKSEHPTEEKESEEHPTEEKESEEHPSEEKGAEEHPSKEHPSG